MTIAWKDTSTFSKGDKERVPKSFRAFVGGITISVHRHIHYAPDMWLVTCEPWFDCKEIGTGTVEDAKEAAVSLVKGKLAAALSSIN